MVDPQPLREVFHDLVEELFAPVADDNCGHSKAAYPAFEECSGYSCCLLVEEGHEFRVFCEGICDDQDELVAGS